MMVKRIVGRPGEQVAIRGGDIFLDGAILRKSIEPIATIGAARTR